MLVCDVLSRDWRISFGNAACADMLGVPRRETVVAVWALHMDTVHAVVGIVVLASHTDLQLVLVLIRVPRHGCDAL